MIAELYLVRHGQTEWSHSGRHTGRTDIPLTELGRERAAGVGGLLASLAGEDPLTPWSSPLGRARDTARLAGFADPEIVDDLREWDYGDYEGTRTADVRERIPGWSVWTHPIENGESVDEVGARADAVLGRLEDVDGTVVLFSHAHFLRILTARWLGLAADAGRLFALDAASVSRLGRERETAVVSVWNLTARAMPEHPGPRR